MIQEKQSNLSFNRVLKSVCHYGSTRESTSLYWQAHVAYSGLTSMRLESGSFNRCVLIFNNAL